MLRHSSKFLIKDRQGHFYPNWEKYDPYALKGNSKMLASNGREMNFTLHETSIRSNSVLIILKSIRRDEVISRQQLESGDWDVLTDLRQKEPAQAELLKSCLGKDFYTSKDSWERSGLSILVHCTFCSALTPKRCKIYRRNCCQRV